MNYKLEAKAGKLNIYSPTIGMYLMEDATVDQVKFALATEMEYRTKLEIVKLLMTFPHGFFTMNDEKIVNKEAVDKYESWYKRTHQKIVFIEEYYKSIDEKIEEILKK